MIRRSHHIVALATLAAGLLPAAAPAQQPQYDGFAYDGQAPLPFPYVSTLPSAPAKRRTAHTRRPLRDKPMVIETKRAAADGPLAAERDRGKSKARVIHAEAEVTIFGPDRMIIRLYRKKRRGNAGSVRAD